MTHRTLTSRGRITRHGTGLLVLLGVLAPSGCSNKSPAATIQDARGSVSTIDAATVADAYVRMVRPRTFDTKDAGSVALPVVRASTLALDKVVGGASKMVGVGEGHAFRRESDTWQRIALQGIHVVDVTFARDNFWLLGTEEPVRTGRVFVLRLESDGNIIVHATLELNRTTEQRSLLVLSPTEFYVAGSRPTFIRWKLGYTIVEPGMHGDVAYIRQLKGEYLLARMVPVGDTLSIFRWNSAVTVHVPELLDVLLDPRDTEVVVFRDGHANRTTPGHETEGTVFAPKAPFVPKLVRFLSDGTLCAAASGQFARFLAGNWQSVALPSLRDPIAIIESNGLVIVARDGMVVRVGEKTDPADSIEH